MGKLLTTGEAAKLLQISRSTVSRKFDQGLLRGKLNPITGERMVSRESVAAFLRQHNVPVEHAELREQSILLSSGDTVLKQAMEDSFSQDERLRIETTAFGSDALVACSQGLHDLLVIDEEIPDILCSEVIRSIRRTGNRTNLRILCCRVAAAHEACLEWGADEAVSKKPITRVALERAVYGLLGIPEVPPPDETTTFQHRRRWPRIDVRFQAKLAVYRTAAPRQRDPGEAIIENISRGGAYLTHVTVASGTIPTDPFRILIEVNEPPLDGWRAHSQVVRLQSIATLTAAVQFVKISKENVAKIAGIPGA